jgi:hypothetical protein
MIILRVAQGRAWTSNTVTMGAVSAHLTNTNIRFNPPVPTDLGVIESQFDSYDATAETKLGDPEST